MNCINCYHYDACASVDVTGYVADIEHEEECEHFKTKEDVHPTAHWVKQVKDYGPGSKNLFIVYGCSRCGNTTSIKSFTPEEWYGYFKDNYIVDPDCLHKHCLECGAKMDLAKTDHANHYIYENREEEYNNA